VTQNLRRRSEIIRRRLQDVMYLLDYDRGLAVWSVGAFQLVQVGTGPSTYRLNATISLLDRDDREQWRWQLSQALPIKFKSADLDARSNEVGIEELHISHQGLSLLPPS
jgi:phage tail-like protein